MKYYTNVSCVLKKQNKKNLSLAFTSGVRILVLHMHKYPCFDVLLLDCDLCSCHS